MSEHVVEPIFQEINCAKQIVDLFNDVFFEAFNTKLQGGSEEPLYLPARVDVSSNIPATIYFRHDYLSSALHEISHWVLAGEARRKLEDYGYWYEVDDRDHEMQKKFEQVEVKPQAIELLLHLAADLPFSVSVDNLSLVDYDRTPFAEAVKSQAFLYCESNLPIRAKDFIEALIFFRGYPLSISVERWLLNALNGVAK